MKTCNRCLIEQPFENYHTHRTTKDRLQTHCKSCRYNTNKRWAAGFKDWARTLKENPCVDCDLRYPYYVMQWHHRDPTTKIMDVGLLVGGRYSKQKVLDEIAKCDLVCSNCHAERTHKNK